MIIRILAVMLAIASLCGAAKVKDVVEEKACAQIGSQVLVRGSNPSQSPIVTVCA